MKKKLALLLGIMIFILSLTPVFAEQSIKVLLDGKPIAFDVNPVVVNGNTLVPLRAIFDALGFKTDWNEESRTVTGTRDNLKVVLQIDSKNALIGDKPHELSVPATVINKRTMVPLRFIAESTGAQVDWDGTNNTVFIQSRISSNQSDIKSGTTEANKEKNTTPVNERGNTPGNLINGGMLAQQGDWIYFVFERKLYKIKTDGTGDTLITDSASYDVHVIGDWIFFSGGTSLNGVYKCKTDGTEKTKLVDGLTINVRIVGDWIYWTDQSKGIYKCKIDGTEKATLVDNVQANNLNIVDDWVYYVTSSKNFEDDFKLCRVKTDGTNNTRVINDRIAWVNIVNGQIYYENQWDKYNIYKSNLDGSNKTKISSDGKYKSSVNVIGEWIFYTTTDYSKTPDGKLIPEIYLHKIKSDGTGYMKLNSEQASTFIWVSGDWVYFYEEGHLSRINFDGTNKQIMH